MYPSATSQPNLYYRSPSDPTIPIWIRLKNLIRKPLYLASTPYLLKSKGWSGRQLSSTDMYYYRGIMAEDLT
jgi:hypothetical protein